MKPRDRFAQALAQRPPGKSVPRWFWWVFVAFPVLFMLIGLGFLADAIIFVSEAQSTQGRVVDISRSYDDEGRVSFTPTIRYSRSDGQMFDAETNMSSGSYDYSIGEQVDILYAFDAPEVVRIDSFFSLYGIGLIFTGFGALFLRIVTWARRKVGNRMVRARSSENLAATMRKDLPMRQDLEQEGLPAEPTAAEAEPVKPEHFHAPRPKQTPTIRRMR